MTQNMTAPMTPAAAASAFSEYFLTHSPNWATVPKIASDWFAANWPQPVAVTGRALYEALVMATEGTARGWDEMDAQQRNDYDRAAARLSVPVFDVEAVAREIADSVRGYTNGSDYGNSVDAVAAILRRHAAPVAPARVDHIDVPAADILRKINDALPVAPAAPVVVEVTGEDLESVGIARDSTFALHMLNARLRARAADVVGCRVVKRPTEEVTALVVPEDGDYIRDLDGVYQSGVFCHRAGERITYDAVTRIRRIDTDAPTTWIERTTQPVAREWRAGDVPEGQSFMLCLNDGPSGWVYHISVGREAIAKAANEKDASAIMVLPAAVGATHG